MSTKQLVFTFGVTETGKTRGLDLGIMSIRWYLKTCYLLGDPKRPCRWSKAQYLRGPLCDSCTVYKRIAKLERNKILTGVAPLARVSV